MIKFLGFRKRKHGDSAAGSETARHDHERRQFRAVLESINATRIPDRLKILDEFLTVELHITLADMLEFIKVGGNHDYDLEFLRETMEMFCQCGFAQKNEFETQETTYEHHHLGEHHDHFICISCGLIREFRNSRLESLQLEIASGCNFHPLQHKMEIYGLCDACLSKREKNPPLSRTAVGEKVRVVEVVGGRQFQARMTAMGLNPGVLLEVINNNPAGPFIVAVQGTRLALDADMAQSVLVSHACRHKGDEDG
ncbi:MAG: transcriptional repressor [Desulfurivibrionaceae bacterium]|nr:FeoA domain-containing protein [Desulfobulbales bacterium]MDT8334450.1 transcriptional repressor [Desulfurivibrionaceae bacterium]